MDWPTFLAALAQSAAAVVAIVLGMLASRVLGEASEFARERGKREDLLAKSRALAARWRIRPTAWFERATTRRALDEVWDSMADGRESLPVESHVAGARLSVLTDPEEVRREIAKFIELRKAGRVRDDEEYSLFPQYKLEERALASEWLIIDALISETREHVWSLERFVAGAREEPWRGRVAGPLGMSVTLFLAAVVYPLGVLPSGVTELSLEFTWASVIAAVYSVRGLLLAILAAVFFAFTLEVLRVNHGLRFTSAELCEVEKWARLSAYSSSLTVSEESHLQGPREHPSRVLVAQGAEESEGQACF